MAAVLDVVASLRQVDAARRLCDAQRSRLGTMRRGDRRHGDAAIRLALAEDALTILMTIHRLALRLDRHASATHRPERIEAPPAMLALPPSAPAPLALPSPALFRPALSRPATRRPFPPHPLRRSHAPDA